MKASKYMTKFAWINVWHKKQRARLSIVAICLSTAILFSSLTIFKNIYHFSKNEDIVDLANYHYAINAGLDITFTPRYQKSLDGNTGYFGTYQNQNFNLRSMKEENGIMPFKLVDGGFAKDDDEIVVSEKWNLNVGEQISLSYGTLDYEKNMDSVYRFPSSLNMLNLENQETQTFVVSGVYEDDESFGLLHHGVDLCYTTLPMMDDVVYYVIDSQVQVSDSFEQLIELMNVDSRGTVSNSDYISLQMIQLYLQDTTMLLIILILIICLSLIMSFISVHNVVIISDKERKKEIGLLKSVGATSFDIRKLLNIELLLLGVIGAIFGTALGIVISYFVLNKFCQVVYIQFKMEMIIDPLVILISLLGGISLMYLSGMKAYRQYIHTSPISDLKDTAYNYNHPVSMHDKYHRSFEFKMFTIYNKRMRSQTKNILYSFMLLLSTTVLFMSIALSNQIYKNKYVQKDYDFEITNYRWNKEGKDNFKCPNPTLSYMLYDKAQNNELEYKSIYSDRFLMSVMPGGSSYGSGATAGFYSEISTYDTFTYDFYKESARNFSEDTFLMSVDGSDKQVPVDFCNVYYSPAVLDQVQIEKLKPYLQEGSLDDLGSHDVVAVLQDSFLGSQLCQNLKVGDSVYYGGILHTLGLKQTVKAIVVLPASYLNSKLYEFSTESFYPFHKFERVMAFSLEGLLEGDEDNLIEPYAMGSEIDERIYIDLQNEATAANFQTQIEQLIMESDSADNYQYINYVLLQEASRMTTFLIETLLYPLLLMLFIVSIMNMLNVFAGNIHLKERDISMMKSIGMTNKQSKRLFTYEYEEGYMSAAVWVILVFVPLAMIENKLPIDSSFSFGANVVGIIILSLLVLDICITIPLVMIALSKVKKIKPLDKLHQTD